MHSPNSGFPPHPSTRDATSSWSKSTSWKSEQAALTRRASSRGGWCADSRSCAELVRSGWATLLAYRLAGPHHDRLQGTRRGIRRGGLLAFCLRWQSTYRRRQLWATSPKSPTGPGSRVLPSPGVRGRLAPRPSYRTQDVHRQPAANRTSLHPARTVSESVKPEISPTGCSKPPSRVRDVEPFWQRQPSDLAK